LGFASDIADSFAEHGIGGIEGGGRLRPDDQIGVRGRSRTRRRLSLARGVQAGRTQADSAQVPQRALEILFGPVASLQHRDVLLHQASGSVRGQNWRTDQSSGLQHDDSSACSQQERLAFAALPSLRAQYESGGQGCIDHHDFERQPVHAGYRRNVGERDVVDLSDAQQVPGKSSNASAGQFHRDPDERSQKKSPAAEGIRVLAWARQQADHQAEDAVIDGEIEAEKNQQPAGGECTHAAVLSHGVVDPVTSPGVPQDAAAIGQKKSLTRLCGKQFDSRQQLQCVWLPGPQERNQQWRDGHPSQKIQIGQGKDDNLQGGRKQHQQPRALVYPQHVVSITKGADLGRRTSDLGLQTSAFGNFKPQTSGPDCKTSNLRRHEAEPAHRSSLPEVWSPKVRGPRSEVRGPLSRLGTFDFSIRDAPVLWAKMWGALLGPLLKDRILLLQFISIVYDSAPDGDNSGTHIS
jgi:hypothetical protein